MRKLKLLPSSLDQLVVYRWRRPLIIILVLSLISFMLFWRLDTLNSGPSLYELEQYDPNLSLSVVFEEPINWLYKLLTLVSTTILGQSYLALKIPAVGLGLVSLWLFFYLLKQWYWSNFSIIGTLLLVGSSWFLHFTRTASPVIMLVPLILGLLIILTKIKQTQSLGWLLALGLLLVVGIYTPLFLYLAIPIILIQLKTAYSKGFDFSPARVILPSLLVLVGLMPAILASLYDSDFIREFFFMPAEFGSITGIFASLLDPIRAVFINNQPFPALNLGELPMLELFSASLLMLGFYQFASDGASDRRRVLGLLFVSATVMLAINPDQSYYLVLLVPAYILISTGINTLARQWNEIFPKNPFAKIAIVVPFAVLLTLTLNYHYQRYFVAWPNAPETAAVHDDTFLTLKDELNSGRYQNETTKLLCNEANSKVCQLANHAENAQVVDRPGEIEVEDTVIIVIEQFQEFNRNQRNVIRSQRDGFNVVSSSKESEVLLKVFEPTQTD